MANLLTFGESLQHFHTAKPQTAGIKMMLNTAEPNMVPVPMSSSEMNTPINEVNSSGAEVPMAINVAPAMSDGNRRPLLMNSSDDRK